MSKRALCVVCWNSFCALPHCLRAKGSRSPSVHCLTASAVGLLLRTACGCGCGCDMGISVGCGTAGMRVGVGTGVGVGVGAGTGVGVSPRLDPLRDTHTHTD